MKHKQGHINKTETPKQIMKQRIEDGVCCICGGIKSDKKWEITNFCGVRCFGKYYET